MEDLKKQIEHLRLINRIIFITMMTSMLLFMVTVAFNLSNHFIINESVSTIIFLVLIFIAFGCVLFNGIYETKLSDAKQKLQYAIEYNNFERAISLVLAGKFLEATDEYNQQIDDGHEPSVIVQGLLLGIHLCSLDEDVIYEAKDILLKMLKDNIPN